MNKFNKFNNFFDKATCPNCGSIMTVFYPTKYVCPKCNYKRTGYIIKAKAPEHKKLTAE